MARDISELGADVIDDTPVDPKHKMSKKKRNYIIGLSITGALVAGITIGTIILAKTVLSDYSNVENVTYYLNQNDNGSKTAVLYKLKSDVTYPSTFRIPSQVKGYKVVGVAEDAFAGHKELKQVIMPNTLKYVGEKAFYNCSNLASFTWSKNLDEVGVDAFLNTKFYNNLLKDTKSMTYLPSGLLIYVGKDYFGTGTALVSKEMKNVSIDDISTRYGVAGINKIEVFEDIGINNMCSGAFKGNDKIVFIDLPSHLTTISNSTFEGCKNLQGLVGTNSGVTEISKRAFADCSELSHIELPTNLTSIGDEAFSNTGLTDYIPDLSTVEFIGESVFADCKSLTSLTYNGTVVPNYTFSGCTNLETIEWGVDNSNINNVTSFGIGAFKNTGFTSFVVPMNVATLSDELFKDCDNLQTVSLFEGTLILKPSAEEEEKMTFVDYDGVTHEDVVETIGVTSIRAEAFNNCKELKTIKLVDDSYLDVTGRSATGTFNFPMTLQKTDVAMTITGSNNYTFAFSKVEKIVIQPNLRTIGSYAFYQCKQLAEIKFENPSKSVIYNIKSNAFAYCESLTEVTIPTSLAVLGPSAFNNCKNLTSINTGDLAIESFSAQLFAGCENLTSVTIPSTVENIKERTFYHNYLLQSVFIDRNINEIVNSAFEEMRHEGEEAMPIFFNFTHAEAIDMINYKENKFCDSTCKAYYLLGEGETPDANLNYWHDVGGVPTPYNPG